MNVNYGPLAQLIGTYKGDKGFDIAPNPDGKEENEFYETIVFTEAGDTVNAEEQRLAAIHYNLVVNRKSDHKVLHSQTGYWMWDEEKDEVIQSIAIPRAVCVLSSGNAKTEANGEITITVQTDENSETGGIIQTSFMHKKAKSTSFKLSMTIKGDELQYEETTMVDIFGKSFEHIDTNILRKV